MTDDKNLKPHYVKVEDNQPPLFPSNELEEWRNEWKDMPEYVSEKRAPFREMIVRFTNQEAVDDFCRRLGQEITPETKNIWHPPLERKFYPVRYADES